MKLIAATFCLGGLLSIQAQELKAYWGFEDELVDRAPAGEVADQGTWVGTPSYTATSPFGDALLLDGTNHVEVAGSVDLNALADQLTISGWIRVDAWDSASQVVLSKGANSEYAVQRAGSSALLEYRDGATNPAGEGVADGGWHHFTAVSTPGEAAEIFIDGELAGAGGMSAILDGGGTLGIGNDPETGGRGWKGAIDEIGIFQEALNAFQVAAIYRLAADDDFRYRLPQVTELINRHAEGPAGDSLLINDETWVYAAADPGGNATFVLLGADQSGMVLSEAVTIRSFEAQPNLIAAGSQVTLSWQLDPPFTTVEIAPDVGVVTANTDANGFGSITVNPTETTTYTITAANDEGENLRRTTVFVDFDPTEVRINEFMASPLDGGEVDEDGEERDWIEIYYPGNGAITLNGYYLTDDRDNLKKWAFPDGVVLFSNPYVRVFASGEDRRDNNSFLHTNFSLSRGGEYLALTRNTSDGGVEIVHQFSPNYPQQLNGVSYGYSADGSQLGYFANPTPRVVNGNPKLGIVEDTKFSVTRGFFTEPFSVTITSDTPDAEIRYTTDGSEPTESHGMIYDNPIPISATTILRAAAFKEDFEPTNVDTQSYLFARDIWNQFANGEAPSGWPAGAVNGQVFDYGMDPQITNSVGEAAMIDALTAIPTISVVLNQDSFTGQSGIYTNPNSRGPAWERAASMELVDPNGGDQEFQVDCGIRIRGGFSRSGQNPKHAFRFFFRSEYGDSKLNYPLFGTEGAGSFDKIDLRTSQNYSWSFQGANLGSFNTYLREVLGRDLQGQFGSPHTRSRYYHLCLNGVYWGLFMTQERADADHAESYLGGDEDDYDTVKPDTPAGRVTIAIDGSVAQGSEANPGSDWARLFYLTRSQQGLSETARHEAYLKMQGFNPDGSRNPDFPVLLDVDELIKYTLVIGYTGNYDAPLSSFVGASNNWFAYRNRESDTQGFSFFVHDGEHSLGADTNSRWFLDNDRINTTNGSVNRGEYNRYNPGFIHQDLAETTESYRMRFADLAHEALFNDGILTPQNVLARIDDRFQVVNQVIDAEAARWGDSKRVVPYGRSNWESAVGLLRNVVVGRRDAFLSHLRQASLYPNLEAPAFSTRARRVEPGDAVFTQNGNGLIYFTTDGSDPRADDGSPAAGVQSADGDLNSLSLLDSSSVWRFRDDLLPLFSPSDVVVGNPAYGQADWKHPDFDDSAWKSGSGTFGFGSVNNNPITAQIAKNNQITSYLRAEFDVAEPSLVRQFTANFVRDDGFIAYLNGVEVFRTGFDRGVVVTAETTAAPANPEDQEFSLVFSTSALVPGRNVFTVELHNSAPTNNDLGFRLALSAETFDPATEVVINEPTIIKSRSFDPTTNEWSALNQGVFSPGGFPTSEKLLITEVNYRPAPRTIEEEATVADRDDFEFIELTNISDETLDLSGAAFVRSLNNLEIEGFEFTFPSGITIAPHEALLVVANRDAFQTRYPMVSSALIVGEFKGGLGNGGDSVRLIDPNGDEIAFFRYGDREPWPSQADGDGASLVLAQPVAGVDYQNPENWVASPPNGGTPGEPLPAGFVGDPTADEDADGISAFYEFFAGTSDSSSASRDLPTAEIVEIGGARYGAIRFRQAPEAATISFVVESSETLEGAWSTTPVAVSQATLAGGRIEHVYRQALPLDDGAAARFLRVRINQ